MVDRERIEKYLEDIDNQVKDLESLIVTIPDENYLKDSENFTVIKAIKYSLLVAIEDIIHISNHIVAALGLRRPLKASDAIQGLAEEGIISKDFAREISGMINFRNRLAHEYLPDQFEAERLFENIKRVDDFKKFAQYIERYIETID